MVMTSVRFERFEFSHSIGMSGERHQMVCQVRMLSFQSHKVSVYYTAKGAMGRLGGQEWDKDVGLSSTVMEIWKLPKTNQR